MQSEHVKAFAAAMLAVSNMGQAGTPTVEGNFVKLNGIHDLKARISKPQSVPEQYGLEILTAFAGSLYEDNEAEETFTAEYHSWYDQLKDLPLESIKHVYPEFAPVIAHLEEI